MITHSLDKYQSETRVEELVRALVSRISPKGDTMVWIGSGLSMGCGYPGWPNLVTELCNACIPGKADIGPSTVAADLLLWAQRCKDTNPDRYFRTLEDIFGAHPINIRPAYSSICGCPFSYLVTTNFDPCLSTAIGRQHGIVSYPDLTLFSLKSENPVIYLHGRARNNRVVSAKNLLLTSNDLDEAYVHSFIPSALDQLLGSLSTIFVGCGLEEIVLRNVFKKLKDIHEHTGISSKRKTMLLADEADSSKREAQNRNMEELGIEILRFPLDIEPGKQSRYHYLDDIWARVRDELRQSLQPIASQ